MEQITLDRLTGLIAFAKAAALGSYSAAARELGVSPSAVSKSIARLERHLGIPLFIRTTRSLRLTHEGEALQERAMRLLQEAEEIQQAAISTRRGPSGVIRVAAPYPIGVHVLGPALTRFRERHPGLMVDLRIRDQMADLISEGIDIAIRVGDIPDSRLISRRLAPHRVCAFAAPGYLARKGTPRHPEELSGHDCVNFRFQSSGQALRWPFAMDGEVIEIAPHAGIVADVSDVVASIVIAGGGIGIMPTYLAAPHVGRGELVPLMTRFAVTRWNITALWPESRRASPNVKAFLGLLEEVFSAPPPWDVLIDGFGDGERKG
ncbi:LysR family transcriptional regulator [Burkholderia gladioli]|uniref:LysR family transcriptional regulator n=1 Tax=Burkholderia gladioli TaxID=28095 RepID=UPI000F811960|nr:LysR family transcriptional regulator [Burkholderia gladioli]MDN7751001.1 LysR family transcriptional regulator [Burkholderia gladioli]